MPKNQSLSDPRGARTLGWGTWGGALALAVILSGCVVGPAYDGAPASALHDLHNTAPQALSATPPALDQWWSGFNDPALTRVVQRALRQNLDLAAAVARVGQARAAAREVGAQRLPQVATAASLEQMNQSLTGAIGAIAHHLPGYRRDQTDYDVGAGASWEVDLFGGQRRSAEAARDEWQAAQSRQLALRVTIVAEAADAYLQVRGDQQRLVIAQSQVQTDGRLLKLIQLRFAKGAATGKEVAQAEALLSQARATQPPLRSALESQLNRLDVLIGAQPGTYAGRNWPSRRKSQRCRRFRPISARRICCAGVLTSWPPNTSLRLPMPA